MFVSIVTKGGIQPLCVTGMLEARMAWAGRVAFEAERYSGISLARDAAAIKFVESGASHWLSVDDDQAWDVAAAEKLIDLNVDIALGVYCTKDDKCEPVLRPVPATKPAGPWTLNGGGGGFQLVKRGAIVRLLDEHRNSRYRLYDGREVVALHQQFFHRDGYQGEDTALHARWRDVGGLVWAHPDAIVGHCSREDITKVYYPKW